MNIKKPSSPLKGELTVPGDKSISHRAVMFGAIANGTTRISTFFRALTAFLPLPVFRSSGISIENTPSEILVHGKGLHGLSAPSDYLDTGNSGTTTRLIAGILAGPIYLFSHWRCFHSNPPYETDHPTPFPDGRFGGKSAGK